MRLKNKKKNSKIKIPILRLYLQYSYEKPLIYFPVFTTNFCLFVFFFLRLSAEYRVSTETFSIKKKEKNEFQVVKRSKEKKNSQNQTCANDTRLNRIHLLIISPVKSDDDYIKLCAARLVSRQRTLFTHTQKKINSTFAASRVKIPCKMSS